MIALAAAVVLLAAAAATAAPSSPGAAKRRFVASANGICGRSAVRLERLTRIANLATRASRGFTELDRMNAALARLTPPRRDERTVSRMLGRFRRFSAALRHLARAEQHGGDEATAVAELVRAKKQAREAALGYGLRTCAGLFG